MPYLPLPFHYMCRSLFKYTRESRTLEPYTWPKVQQKFSVINLLFADDSLVFSKASTADCRKLKDIFYYYAAASGQVSLVQVTVKLRKSGIFFDRILFPNMRNIWVYHPWWGEKRLAFLMT